MVRVFSKRLLAVAIAVGLVVATAGVLLWWHDYPVHHFGVVQEGVLYRSGQPLTGRWRVLADKYHIKTVVSLRGDQAAEATSQSWWREEEEFCRRNGIRFINLPIGQKLAPARGVEEFLAIVKDPVNHPVLVHCQFGSVRTGLAAAAYRIAVQGWSYDDAIAEARKFRYKPEKVPQYAPVLQALAAGRNPD